MSQPAAYPERVAVRQKMVDTGAYASLVPGGTITQACSRCNEA